MRIKLFSAFVLGFAGGMLTITVLLWTGGNLRQPPSVSARQTVVVEPGTTESDRAAPPPSDAASVRPPPVPEVSGAKPVLGMPLAGLDPAKLTTTFYEVHNGHPHEALDIMAPRGTPVQAVDQGNVVKLFTSKQGGLTVYQFDDARDLCYYYAHLDHYAPGLKEGTLLRRGEVLGYVGSTGNASAKAPHLHFAIFKLGPEKEWWKGTAIDPLPRLQGRQP